MTWEVTSKTILLQTSEFTLTAAVVERSGATAQTRYFVEGPDSVIVVPRQSDGRLLLVEVSRPTSGRAGWELPAGRLDKDEPPESAARRQLLEATGHSAGNLEFLGTFLPSNQLFTSRAHAYLAHDVVQTLLHLRNDKVDAVGWFSWNEVLDLIAAGGITDGASLAALTFMIRQGS